MKVQNFIYIFGFGVAILICTEVSLTNGVCFPLIGCFPQEYPWVSPLRILPNPENPLKINISVIFYCRNYTEGQIIQIYPDIEFNIKGYSSNKRTVTITHGFASSSREQWIKSLTNSYLAQMDANIFVLDWGRGAKNVRYDQAVANIRVVGAVLGRFGVFLIRNTSNTCNNFHMIGHSLGAHTAGYAAQVMNKNSACTGKVHRITGIDPAQPGFQNFPKLVRLSSDKGKFVDAIHSNARFLLGVGYASDLGHVDFYLNNGYDQPNCRDKDFFKRLASSFDILNSTETSLTISVSCSHERALHVFEASLNPNAHCKFVGHRIITRLPIISNQFWCGRNNEDCIIMGLDTELHSQRGAFQVMTSGTYPYCCKDYNILTGCSS